MVSTACSVFDFSMADIGVIDMFGCGWDVV